MSTLDTNSYAPAANASVYTDLHGLQSLKKGANPEDPESLRAVAKQFEGMMLSMMMKSMREANAAFEQDGYFNSNETRFYRDMFDQQLTLDMANNGGVGLTDVLVRQLSKQAPNTVPPLEDRGAPPALQRLSRLDRLDRLDRLQPDSEARGTPDAGLELNASPVRIKPLPERSQPETTAEQFMDAVGERIVSAARTVRELAVRAGDEASRRVHDVIDELPQVTPASLGSMVKDAFKAADDAASAAKTFSSPAEFVKKLYPLAEHAAEQIGVDPKALLAQAALETGWGKHVIRSGDDSSYNLFGIKADRRWAGERQAVQTLEYRDGVAEKVRDAFRSYQSYAESFMDYARFLQENPRYEQALSAASDPSAYFDALQEAGYATDPQYSRKIQRILGGDTLNSALEALK